MVVLSFLSILLGYGVDMRTCIIKPLLILMYVLETLIKFNAKYLIQQIVADDNIRFLENL